MGRNALFVRYDGLGLETEHLLFPTFVHRPHAGELIDALLVYTVGAVRDVPRVRGVGAGIGFGVTLYTVPERLRATHGAHPVSRQVFLRVRPKPPAMGRMWDLTMTDTMPPHDVAMKPH